MEACLLKFRARNAIGSLGFYAHEQDILAVGDDEALDTATQAEKMRRRDELEGSSGLAVPVTGEWFEQLKRRQHSDTGALCSLSDFGRPLAE